MAAGSIYSTLSGASIAAFVAARYAIEVASCWLYQRGFNDVYDLRATDGKRYIVRVDSRRARVAPNASYELSLLAHLRASGVAVPLVVSTRHGASSTELATPERARTVSVFSFLSGEPPGRRLPDIALMGEGLARIHVAAASYRGPASAEQLDLEHLVARPLRRIAALPHVGSDVHEKLAALGAELVQRISAIDGLARVACHGDCHGANTLVHDAPDGTRAASFFDFDDGGPGWLAYDLCVYLWAQLVHGAKMNEGGGERWRALVEGYRRVAPIAELDYDAIAAFVSARHFWFLGEYATRLDEWGATSLSEAWLREQVDQLASWRALTTPPSASP